MRYLSVSIVQWVDDSQPGWVKCELADDGRTWIFIEKAPIVSEQLVTRSSSFPLPGVIACEVIEQDPHGLLTVDTSRPWGIQASSGETRFDVKPDQMLD